MQNQTSQQFGGVPNERREKRSYIKPTIERVDLRPEEAVLGACKTSTSAGPAASSCTTLGCSANAS
jgi:hypothetical protein